MSFWVVGFGSPFIGDIEFDDTGAMIIGMGDRYPYQFTPAGYSAMYTANHLPVKAIIALTESGSTALWMSRIRSDIPIFAFTRHEATRRRVVMYRGVYPVAFDITHTDIQRMYQEIFSLLLSLGHVNEGDLVLVTKGELSGIALLQNNIAGFNLHRLKPRINLSNIQWWHFYKQV